MGRRICTDIGGTFTDIVVVDEQRGIGIFKSFTTRKDLVQGVLNGLQLAAEAHGQDLAQFLGECDYFGHGSTVATNAVIEGKVAKSGLICTRGFRDILALREEAPRENPFTWDMDSPGPYIPRYLTVPVTERINAEGGIEIPLVEQEVLAAIAYLKQYGVQAVAVSLLWSIANPVHELRVAELIRQHWPEVKVSLSHVVNPVLGEYRRTISTAMDASLKPLVDGYIGGLGRRLREAGYRGELSLLSSSGGVLSTDEMLDRPIFSLDSGPAQAPIAGRFYAKVEAGVANVITCDMGGTSFDVSRVTDGVIVTTEETRFGPEKLSIPKAETRSIGAGGGSIAWVDSGGLLHLGPEGAGSEPGPACYRRGGTRPTVTDANLVLGYLDPDYFLGGSVKLDPQAAAAAIEEHVAKPLGLSVLAAAAGIWRTVSANMTEAIRDITVYAGFDPREYVCVSGGGAGAIHICEIVRDLDIRQVVIPRTAGALSAFGGTIADVVREFQSSHFTVTSSFDYVGVSRVLAQLAAEGRAFLDASGVPAERQVLEFGVIARYRFQDFGIPVALRGDGVRTPEELAALVADFHATHERLRGSREPGQTVECLRWRLLALGRTPELALRPVADRPGQSAEVALKGQRPAYFQELGGMVETPVYDAERLPAGAVVQGPAIIEEPTTTVLVLPDWRAQVSRFGNYVLEMGGKD